MLWEELVKTALLGTNRSTLSKEVLQTLAANGIDTDEENAKIILQAATYYGQQRKVGFVLPAFLGQLPIAIPTTEVRICSDKSSRHLALILKEHNALILSEFIEHLTLNKKQLPPESLPKLLNDYQHQSEFRTKLLPVLGERGRWLIQQNPAWSAFLPNTDLSTWETAKKEERLSLLQYLRHTQPAKALELLQQTWAEELLKDQIDFLKILEIRISKNDEDFLEKLLDHPHKSVRAAAARLLSSIENSALVERMYQRVVAYFSYQKGLLSVQLPEELDETAMRDGIYGEVQKYSGGLKASRLGQMMSKIPPARWANYFQTSVDQTLEILMRSSWSAVILQALIEALLHFPQPDWIKAIVSYWLKNEDLEVWQHATIKKFIAIIPSDIFNQVVYDNLKHRSGLLDENAAVSRLLRASEQPWSDEVTLLLMKNFRHWLNTTDELYWNMLPYQQLLLVGSHQCNPDLYQNLSLDWNFSNRIARNFQHEVERFLRTLLFRKNMILELKRN